jgi:hypothetical protein
MDRQDIDALLIGALYGELTPADEARLTAHLDSHPTDRGALDDLKSARQAVRESRIFELQLDPPQAVSALLLQEAHRRAPKRVVQSEEKESWFYRFTKMFLAHPAMAAAAMLVLVVGVASMIYTRKGDQFANKEIAEPTVQTPAQAPAAATELPPAEAPADNDSKQELAEGAEGSAYRVGLDDATTRSSSERLRREVATADDARRAKTDKLEQQQLAKNNKTKAIIVTTPQPEPKELDAPKKAGGKAAATRSDDFGGEVDTITTTPSDQGFSMAPGAIGNTGTGNASSDPSGRAAGPTAGAAAPQRNAPSSDRDRARAPAPPPPPASATPPAVTTAPRQPTTTAKAPATPAPAPKPSVTKDTAENKTEAKPQDPPKDSALIAWAKQQHSRAQSHAGNGNCSEAAKVAIAIQNRAPDYYTQFVGTDRALKKCQAYISQERDAEAERSGKARSQKRVNADEPSSVK